MADWLVPPWPRFSSAGTENKARQSAGAALLDTPAFNEPDCGCGPDHRRRVDERQALYAKLLERGHLILKLCLRLHCAQVHAQVRDAPVPCFNFALDREQPRVLEADVLQREVEEETANLNKLKDSQRQEAVKSEVLIHSLFPQSRLALQESYFELFDALETQLQQLMSEYEAT